MNWCAGKSGVGFIWCHRFDGGDDAIAALRNRLDVRGVGPVVAECFTQIANTPRQRFIGYRAFSPDMAKDVIPPDYLVTVLCQVRQNVHGFWLEVLWPCWSD